MKLEGKLLEKLVDEVVLPVEKLLRKRLLENGFSDKKAIVCLKDIGVLKMALLAFKDVDIQEIKKELTSVENLHSLCLDKQYIQELLCYFFDLLREFFRKYNFGSLEDNKDYDKVLGFLKKGNSVDNEEILEDEFLDFSEENVDDTMDNMHYTDEEKISAVEYMSSDYLDFDLLEDIKDVIEKYGGISYEFSTFNEEYADEVVLILQKFIALFELSGEFRSLAKIFNYLVETINSLKNGVDDDKRDLLKLFIDAIMEDLMKWYDEVIVNKSANDIHYLDASLLSSVKQIEVMFKDSIGGGNLFEK